MLEKIKNIFTKKTIEPEMREVSTIITIDDLSTKNFKKEDWFKTNTGLNNTPTAGVLICLFHISRKMQKIRDVVNMPINITSAYRSREVNSKVKGSPRSLHMQGLACDFIIVGKSPQQTADIVIKACKDNKISFDKILIENSIVHIQFAMPDDKNRNFIGTAQLVDNKWVVNELT